MNTVKPTIIEVTRFYRPRHDTHFHDPKSGHIMSDHGVTVMFTLNYETLTYKARWSICNGDNFSKVEGIQWAQACPTPINGTIHPGWSLYDEILHELTSINQRYVESKFECSTITVTVDFEYDKQDMRNFALLQSEIMKSMKQS